LLDNLGELVEAKRREIRASGSHPDPQGSNPRSKDKP
jgi:hypothetical protein